MLTRLPRGTEGRERGQMLIMALLLLVLLLGFAAIVVDVGFFLQRRERVQHIADAAALAGAQELPDDRSLAEDIARTWAIRNGLDDLTRVDFECRAENAIHCQPSGYDTILVEGEMRAPLTLMPVLRLIGADDGSCWFNDGCTATGTAAACRGECSTAVTPVDLVLIIDRTSSMGDDDLANAKNAARAVLEFFNPQVQHVALGVLNAGDPNDLCGDEENDLWVPVPLSDDYQNADGSLNTGSLLVSTINCLVTISGTNLGEPVKRARQHLQNNGRPDVKWAIVLLSDGRAHHPGDNPCLYAYNQASEAKAQDIGIFTIGFGVEGEDCDDLEPPYVDGVLVTQLLADMATDADHVFIEPKSGDLAPVFKEIGRELASGSRLVE